jgi:hypothetical protein
VPFAETNDEIVFGQELGGVCWWETAGTARGGEGQKFEEAGVGAWIVVLFMEWWLRANLGAAERCCSVCHLWCVVDVSRRFSVVLEVEEEVYYEK